MRFAATVDFTVSTRLLGNAVRLVRSSTLRRGVKGDIMSRPVINLSGRVFTDWTVLRQSPTAKGEPTAWECQCACGNTAVVFGGNLVGGASKRCLECRNTRLSRLNTTSERQQRLQRILKLRHQRKTLKFIAADVGVTFQRIHQILRKYELDKLYQRNFTGSNNHE
jgi:hypothetical protein